MPAVSRVGVGFIMPPLPPLEPRQGPAVGIIEATGCKWPVAEDASLIGGHECCNGTRVTGSSYCAHHKAKAKSPTFVKSWMDRAA
jgi:hypothetical protein